MKTVHLVLNSHIDPIWLWSWRDGLDEILNTCRYICDLLDENPDIIYTRGEAWVYEKILQIDPELFERIHTHILAGRWSVVGGWYIQPDCNQPSGFALKKQIDLGKEFFTKHFGDFPKVAYNVDSFGHAATFPRYISEAGQSYYVMMRPSAQEMPLPSRLFRWKEQANGPEIVVFRIADGYNCNAEESVIKLSLTQLPEEVNHTMCFVGIGDHGGGPTQKMINWCREHQTHFPDTKIIFSSPDQFFAAIQKDFGKLPLVVGELQQHAIGCYSVHHRVKKLLKHAEHSMAQAELAVNLSPSKADPCVKESLETAWKRICFHHFHDTLGGTCLPTAYREVEAQLGQAIAIADEEGAIALRRIIAKFPDDAYHRLIFLNASGKKFDDYVEIEPWLEWTPWDASWGIVDEGNQLVAFQIIDAEAGTSNEPPHTQTRLTFRVKASPGETKIFRIVNTNSGENYIENRVLGTISSIRNKQGISLDLKRTADGIEFPGLQRLSLPILSLYDDPTDTWSHGISRYERKNQIIARWEEPHLLDQGPLMASLMQRGIIGGSELLSEWRIYQEASWIEWYLRISWAEKKRVLKIEWNLPEIIEREDGILGGSLVRPLDGRELPLRDWTHLRMQDSDIAIISPEVYALDAEAQKIGLTLLRGAVLACHDPHQRTDLRAVYSDRGEQTFRFRFLAGEQFSAKTLDQIAYGMQRPLLSAEMTKGMKTSMDRGKYLPLYR